MLTADVQGAAISSGPAGHSEAMAPSEAWTGRLDKLIFLTNHHPDTQAIKQVATSKPISKTHYHHAWSNEIRPGVTFNVHHRPRWSTQKYYSKFETNPDRFGSFAATQEVIDAVYPGINLAEPKVSAIHCAVDLPGPTHPWRELKRKTFFSDVQDIQIYNGGFAIGTEGDKRLSIYWRWLKYESEDDKTDKSRIEIQLTGKYCSQFTLANLVQLKTLNPFQTHGVEFWTPVNIEDRSLSELDMLKVAGAIPLIDYCGSYFHFYKVLNQNQNFKRHCSKLFEPCSDISAARLDAIFSARMKAFFSESDEWR